MNKSTIWKGCCIAVLCITILTFTPLITPASKNTPFLLGMPYTLWIGLLITFLLLLLTIIGSWVHPSRQDQND